ncbi:RING-H2 finger protein ATL20-like [Papaver somniferum]|uniref:RING-H2 finger protein ATL20-like n=1 Tax=Papaver somniferum TaxID=3469 RepID=UPI000E7043BE|nr:RING-H2 finger protein ATL20-like [Papaver somniferum]
MSRTVLELPFSEPFFVQGINYSDTHNEIQLIDPDNCLAKRFLKQVNLSGTPFIGIEYKNYSFFSCQSETYDLAKDISCLSNSTHQVFAIANTTSSSSSWPHANCTLITTVPVPVESGKDVYGHPWFAYTNVLHLTWPWKQAPYCKRNGCNERSNFPSFRDPDVPRRGGNIFLIVMGILIPTGIASYLCYIILRSKGFFSGRGTEASSWSSSTELVAIATSLDGSAVKSLPTIVVGESGRLPDPDNNICSICLSEYQPKETLKTMPACNHCFHVDCIDVWLLLNSTCPICRISPVSEKIAMATSQGL